MSGDTLAGLLASAQARIQGAYDSAVAVYKQDGGDYNAGRVDGLKEALQILGETLPKG
jgi:hypothetical protein